MVEGGDREPASGHEPIGGGSAPGDVGVGEPDRGSGGSRGRLRGYVVAGAVAGIVLAAAVALLAGAGGDERSESGAGGDGPARGDLLPDGGAFATPKIVTSVPAAAADAGCELRAVPVASRDHHPDLYADLGHSTDPPTSGRHHPMAAADGAYEVPPPVNQIVHSLEHGRVIVWFDRDLPRAARAALKAFYDHDSDKLLLVPDTTGMDYAVAATAWNRDPRPNGTGRLLGCADYGDGVFTALESFKQRHRARGPELIP